MTWSYVSRDFSLLRSLFLILSFSSHAGSSQCVTAVTPTKRFIGLTLSIGALLVISVYTLIPSRFWETSVLTTLAPFSALRIETMIVNRNYWAIRYGERILVQRRIKKMATKNWWSIAVVQKNQEGMNVGRRWFAKESTVVKNWKEITVARIS